MVEIKIILKQKEQFKNDDIRVTVIENHMQIKGIKATTYERKISDKIADFIQSI